jgi:hypothetical protein
VHVGKVWELGGEENTQWFFAFLKAQPGIIISPESV